MREPVRILVVDDEMGMCQLLRAILEGEGYQVEVATTGDAAEEKLRADTYELLITDLKMPGMDGLELVRRARRLHRDLSVVMVTGYATVENAVGALRTGVDDYLTKPFDITELRQTVARTLRNRTLREGNVEVLARLQAVNSELRSLHDRLQQEVSSAHQHLIDMNSVLAKRTRELVTISDVSQALSSTLDLEELLGTCLELVSQEMGVEKASIMLLEPGTEELVVKASLGPSRVNILGERVRMGEGIAGWVARERKPLLIENVNDPPQLHRSRIAGEVRERHYNSVSLICAPLTAKGQVVGVINVNDKTNGEPFNDDDVSLLSTIAGQVAVTIENARLYDQLRSSAFRTVQALVVTLEAKDTYTSGHSQRVTDYATSIGGTLGLSAHDLNVLRYAAQLHDIGKIGITEDILHKPGPLDDGEWQIIRSHPVISERIIQPLDFLKEIRDVVRHHHERLDGSGYPDALAGDDIPMLTRILGVADAYDAMTSRRPYRTRAFSPEQAMGEIVRCQGSQFDPRVVAALAQGDVSVEPGGVA